MCGQRHLRNTMTTCSVLCFAAVVYRAQCSNFLAPREDKRRLSERTAALDAQFLMQATFGPTRASLEDLGGRSYVEWIRNQMALPIESHREFYRQRVNPRFDKSYTDLKKFSEKRPCEEGARWRGYVFTRTDVKKRLKIKAGQFKIGPDWRSDVDPSISTTECTDEINDQMARANLNCSGNLKWTKKKCGSASWKAAKTCRQSCYAVGRGYDGDDCSGGWARYATENFAAYICSVEEAIGGKMELSEADDCKRVVHMHNPAVFVMDSSKIVGANHAFDHNPHLSGVIFLASSPTSCDFATAAAITYGGKYFVHDSRLALQKSTVESPQTSDGNSCAPKSRLNKHGCLVQPVSFQTCPVACGSPGEISNVGKNGHQFSMVTKDKKKQGGVDPDRKFDHGTKMPISLVKTTVWTMRAMQASDQLRQRVAWALSQIIVVGTPGIPQEDRYSEAMMNFYDIFVRHSFGNFRNVLQEVTYSPIMGTYLTYRRSRSYDSSRSYPDENYAREIMQLFTIGVNKLHANGSVVVDENDVPVPAYSNDNIMSFARVFTGFTEQKLRGNIEVGLNAVVNNVDPMTMKTAWHDIFPKPDLDGNYLGDGYPLCSDFQKQAFLSKGAMYEFLGYSHKGEAYAPLQSSGLYRALSRLSSTVTLEENLPCEGDECSFDIVGVVRVGSAYFQYMPPSCVHLFFYNGNALVKSRNFRQAKCSNPDTPVSGFACCSGCKDTPHPWMKKKAIACKEAETKWTKNGLPTMFEKFCNKQKHWRKRKFCQLTCWSNDQKWGGRLAYARDDCSAGPYRENLACDSPLKRVGLTTAKAQCERLGMSLCPTKSSSPCNDRQSYLWTDSPCTLSVRVHADGKVSGHTDQHEQNRFSVTWGANGAAPAGDYNADVTLQQVFTAIPSKTRLHAKLKIGSVRPAGACTHFCDGEVKAYAENPDIFDATTIFECQGRFYKNVESIVRVDGHHFRNPVVFVRPGVAGADNTNAVIEAAMLDEVESLIDHLFHHPNTPVNIGSKLIQRFVTSNPSPGYVEDVGHAFKTGTYDGMRFSGSYGDLGATIAAILLHPEARVQNGKRNGLLREPMLKLIHFMRSMEYHGQNSGPIVLNDLADKIGQFPYKSPTVFNYYNHDFMPARMGTSQHEPEPEPEPEPFVAPEFQILTPPFAVNLLNGFTSLINGRRMHSFLNSPHLAAGASTSDEAPSDGDPLERLNILLTGGRLTPNNAKVVRDAYEQAAPAEGFRLAQQALLLTPEFNNLGEPMPEGARVTEVPVPSEDPKPYKAVVMLFLAGGADTFQMLVPRDCKLHESYKEVRSGIDIPIGDLLPITASTQTCTNFGINPAMPKLKKLYDNGTAAFVSNVGTLTQPTTRSMLHDGAAHLCKSQFSHSHAQTMAQTAQCASQSTAPRGVGGLMADEVAKQGMKTTSFSVHGTATWSQGEDTGAEILDRKEGAVRFEAFDVWNGTINNITRQKHGNIYCESYVESVAGAIASSERLGEVLDRLESASLDAYKKDTALQQQLHQVARIIATREERKAERDFFFVQLGGWDTHAGIKTVLPGKLRQVDDAIDDFVSELRNQSVFESVVLMTESDFGRTLSFNGAGTDHGWGGNHIIVGGGIHGGEVYNDFLETYDVGSDYMTAGRGRVIPKYPWESFMVPVSQWVGIDSEVALSKMFPNLANFNRSVHIIDKDILFKP